jgi:peptide/nickel transport system substrate-binding protein
VVAVRRGTVRMMAAVAAMGCLAVGCKSSTVASSGDAPAAAPTTTGLADSGTPVPGGSLVMGMDIEPNGLNPVSNNFSTSGMLVASSVYETLTAFDKDQKAEPFLAESVEPSDLAAKWTIKLKPNITFSDGAPLDAAAVKANLDAYKAGLASIAMKVVTDIKVVDPSTVEVDMNQPWASFPSLLASQEGMMQSPANINAPDASTHPIGTGPFVVNYWDRGSKLVTKKNPKYWQSGLPYLDGLEYRFLPDPTSRADALQAGDIDMMFSDSPKSIASFKDKQGFKTVIDDSGDVQSIVMNQMAAPFDNEDARKALVLATDDKAITDAFGPGVLSPTDQPFSEANPYHQSDAKYAGFNLDDAKKAVAAYTAATGKPLQFTLTTWTGSDNVPLAQLLQAQWKLAGIDAQISAIDQATGISAVITGKTQALLSPNFGYPDPDWNYVFWHGSMTGPIGQLSVNFGHLKDSALDAALDKGRINLVPSLRKEAYNQATQLLNQSYDYVWVYRYVGALIASDHVHGLQEAKDQGFATIDSKMWFRDLWVTR